jgi:hypothetical protein
MIWSKSSLHTLPSLSEYSDYAEIQALVEELQLWTWGHHAKDDLMEIIPIYKHKGSKRNDRSARPGSNSGQKTSVDAS